MFKWIGLGLGFIGLGLIGAFLGYFVGAAIDRVRALGTGGFNPASAALRQTVFLETLFTLKGMLAKADGVITQNEIDHVEAFIKKAGMTAEHRQQAIALFQKGAQPDFDLAATMNRFKTHCGKTANLRQMLMIYLIVMALADGKLDNQEQLALKEVASHLNYSESEFAQLLNMVMGQSHFAGGSARPASASALEEAYQALGVSADSSDQEIKRAYRKLMSQHHPDKLMGQGVPKDMIDVATEHTKEIQLAYDLIKKHRASKAS